MRQKATPFIIPVFIPHSGCPYQCVFCNQFAITGHNNLKPTIESIRQQIDTFLGYRLKPAPLTQISFYGGNFLGLRDLQIIDCLNIADQYVQKSVVDNIRFSTRPDTIDDRRLAIIRSYPIKTIELGVQSMDDGVLLKIRRGHQAKDTIAAVHRLKEKGYEIGLQLMLGLPGDSFQKTMDSAFQVIALKPDFIRIYPTVVLENSPLAGQWRKGLYQPLSLDESIQMAKTLYSLFQKHRIPVIRMGLQASSDLDDMNTLLAGPYHPAFGHLVQSELFFDQASIRLRQLIKNKNPISEIKITIHPQSSSKLIGYKRQNLEKLKKTFNLKKIHVAMDTNLSSRILQIEPIT